MSVEFFQDSNNDWRWRAQADNSRVIGASTQGYSRRIDAESNFRSLKTYCKSSDVRVASEGATVEFYTDKTSEWRWTITAQNGNIIHASSEGFMRQHDAVDNLKLLVQLAETESA